MALFNPSTISWVTAVQTIADSIGASADTEMTNRAHRSLRAAFQFFGGKHRWDFMRTEAAPQQVQAPFTVTGVSASAGGVSAAVPGGHGFQVDDVLFGNGFLAGMRATSTAASSIGLATAITGLAAGINVITVTGVRDLYALPSDARVLYSVRLLGSQRALKYVGNRLHGRVDTDEYASATPYHYDLFFQGGKGKLKLVRPPASTDVLSIKYYRRFFLASASSMTSALDIHEDYEEYPIAWAKWHFLTDKGEGRKEQAATWFALAQEGLKTMLSEQTNQPDEDLVIVPGHVAGWPSVNDTRFLPFDYS